MLFRNAYSDELPARLVAGMNRIFTVMNSHAEDGGCAHGAMNFHNARQRAAGRVNFSSAARVKWYG
jgi:hypothetical protein